MIQYTLLSFMQDNDLWGKIENEIPGDWVAIFRKSESKSVCTGGWMENCRYDLRLAKWNDACEICGIWRKLETSFFRVSVIVTRCYRFFKSMIYHLYNLSIIFIFLKKEKKRN